MSRGSGRAPGDSLNLGVENSPTGGHHLLETHSYDGQLKALADKVNNKTKYILSVKLKAFHDLKHIIADNQECSDFYKLKALQAVNLIIANTNKPSNTDHTNQVKADDLLMILYFKIKEVPDFVRPLIEQLHDIIVSGQCPQGRCTRLLQLIKCFVNA